MINPYILKKYLAFLLLGGLSSMGYYVGLLYYGLLGGVGGFFAAFMIAVLCAMLLLKHPLRDIIEGKGLLAINIDSTGRMQPFILSLSAPFVIGNLFKKDVKDTFDRDHTLYFGAPLPGKAEYVKKEDKEVLVLTLDKKDVNNARFAFMQWPCFIYNEMLGSLVTKEFLGNKEKDYFTEHTTLTLLQSINELVKKTGDYVRYVINVENRELNGFFGGRSWIWILILIVVLGVAVFAGPQILAALKGAFGAAKSAGTAAATGTTGSIVNLRGG